MWSGFLSVAQDSGLTKELAKKMNPLLHYLFPDIPQGHPATDYISANFIANILGLGWACTPTGLEAMKSLQELEYERNSSITSGCKGYTPDTASDEMCTFLILNISSLQIIPMNLIAYRTGYGSADPMAVIIPGLITTSITTILAIIICRLMTTKRKAKI